MKSKIECNECKIWVKITGQYRPNTNTGYIAYVYTDIRRLYETGFDYVSHNFGSHLVKECIFHVGMVRVRPSDTFGRFFNGPHFDCLYKIICIMDKRYLTHWREVSCGVTNISASIILYGETPSSYKYTRWAKHLIFIYLENSKLFK